MSKKILLVDDEQAHLDNLRAAVEPSGARLLLARSGAQAVELAKSEQPALILMDIVMDEQDGYHACRTLSRDPETKDIPVVFVSSKDNRADKIWAEKQGGRGYITKPYDAAEVMEYVKRFC